MLRPGRCLARTWSIWRSHWIEDSERCDVFQNRIRWRVTSRETDSRPTTHVKGECFHAGFFGECESRILDDTLVESSHSSDTRVMPQGGHHLHGTWHTLFLNGRTGAIILVFRKVHRTVPPYFSMPTCWRSSQQGCHSHGNTRVSSNSEGVRGTTVNHI